MANIIQTPTLYINLDNITAIWAKRSINGSIVQIELRGVDYAQTVYDDEENFKELKDWLLDTY